MVTAGSFGLPLLGATAYVAAAFFVSLLDSTGNVLYLAAVRPLERGAMTAVYATHRDMANVLLPGVFAQLLKVAPLPSVFVATALLTAAMAGLATRLNPRLGRPRA